MDGLTLVPPQILVFDSGPQLRGALAGPRPAVYYMPRTPTVISNLNFTIGTRTHRDPDLRKHHIVQNGANLRRYPPPCIGRQPEPRRSSGLAPRSPMPPASPGGPARSGSPPPATLRPALRPSTTLQHVAAAAPPR